MRRRLAGEQAFVGEVDLASGKDQGAGGETRGRDALVGSFNHIPDYWTSFSVEPEEFIDAGAYVDAYLAGDLNCDITGDWTLNFFDVAGFIDHLRDGL